MRQTNAAARGAASTPAGTMWPWLALTLVAFAIGVFLRMYQLRSQMLIDDEWHAVRMLIRADAEGIASHFGLADYSIPLTLYYRWLYDRAALSEWSMHLPSLFAGIASLLVVPALLRKEVSQPTLAIWTGLLAISPSLIYFSRTARPYALIALLGPIAIVAFRRWYLRQGDRRVWAAIYVVCVFVAGWAHLLSLVFTLWPFAYYGLAALARAVRGPARVNALRNLLALLVLGIVVVLPLFVALLPPLVNDWGAMAAKAGADSVTLESLYRSWLMAFGSVGPWLGMIALPLLGFGAVRLGRRDLDLTALILSAAIVGIVVICAARPAWIEHAPVLVRYCAPILPLLLLFVAEGIEGVIEWITAPRVASVATAAILATWFIAGPLPTWYYNPNQFMDHAIFQFDYDPRANPYATLLELGPISPFWLELAKKPPHSVTVIETPERAQSNFMPDPWLQKIHRQNVKFALAAPVCGEGDWDEYPYTATGTRFTRMARLGDILAGATWGGDYLVMHLKPWTLPAGDAFPWPVAWPDMPACIEKVAAKLGAPTYRDDQLVVFALSKNVSGQAPPAALSHSKAER